MNFGLKAPIVHVLVIKALFRSSYLHFFLEKVYMVFIDLGDMRAFVPFYSVLYLDPVTIKYMEIAPYIVFFVFIVVRLRKAEPVYYRIEKLV